MTLIAKGLGCSLRHSITEFRSVPELSVVTAADGSYVAQACVLARSLSLSQAVPVDLTVLGTGWSRRDVDRLRRAGTERVFVQVIDPGDPRAGQVKSLKHGFPVASMYSVIAPQLRQFDGSERIVYLDADTVVRHDLRPLLSHPMVTPVAAVVDAHVALVGMPSMWRAWREEEVDPMVPYLNTGVMIIEVAAWRGHHVTDRVFDLLDRYALPCVDQDALNLVLGGWFDRLEPRWNLMPYHLMRLLRTSDLVESDESLGDAINDPSIIHYHRSFLGKPWQLGCSHPARKLWRRLASSIGLRGRSLSIRDTARNSGARFVGMSVLDPRCAQLERLSATDSVT